MATEYSDDEMPVYRRWKPSSVPEADRGNASDRHQRIEEAARRLLDEMEGRRSATPMLSALAELRAAATRSLSAVADPPRARKTACREGPPDVKDRPEPSSSAPASSARAPPTTSRSSARPTSSSSTRGRCSRPAARPRTRRASSSRRTARARCAGSRRTRSRCTRRSTSTASRAGSASAGSRSRRPRPAAGAEAAARVRALVRARGRRAPDAGRGGRQVPLLDPSAILGAYHVPSDGIAKAVRIAAALAAKAAAKGVAFEGGVTVTGFDIRDGRVHGVRTDRGDVAVRARADLRRDLGADRRRDGRRADPAARGPAPAGLDRPDPRARGRDARGRPPDPAPPGHGDVLPPPRGPLRGRQLPARADRHAAVRAPAARRQALQPSLMPFTPSDFDVAETEAAGCSRR